jgi:serine/threonine protein kinase
MGQGSSLNKLGDRYYVEQTILGRGTFGTVWRAVDKQNNDIVAVKQLNKADIADGRVTRSEVEREIATHRSCIHKHIVRLFEIFEDKKSIFLALEYCGDGNLADKVKGRGRSIQEHEAADWMIQILSAITALHSKSICHRDIKASNFMFSGNTLKLSDFGLATTVQPGQLLVDKCGTAIFMAPEQHLLPRKSNGYSFPVDLWAAGIIMYLIMETHLPFEKAKSTGSAKKKWELEQLLTGHLIFSGDRSAGFSGAFSAFSPREEDRFSDAARRFCRRLVCPNPATRFTAEAALHDPWLNKYNKGTSCGSRTRAIPGPIDAQTPGTHAQTSGGRAQTSGGHAQTPGRQDSDVWAGPRSVSHEGPASSLDEEPDENPDENLNEEPQADDWMLKLMKSLMVECGCPQHKVKVRS